MSQYKQDKHGMQASRKKNTNTGYQMKNKDLIDAGHLFNKEILIQNTS